VRVFGAVVQVAMLPMFHIGEYLTLRGPIAFQLIGDEHPGDILAPFEELQELRSASQPLQRWQQERAALETELLLEFVDTELLRMPFPLQDTKGD
jgi:hypothetical protein